jgi:hypothetical protein
MKPVRLIYMRLNETYSEVRKGKYLFNALKYYFRIHH